MFCGKCGARNIDSNSFCTNCGSSLKNENSIDYTLSNFETGNPIISGDSKKANYTNTYQTKRKDGTIWLDILSFLWLIAGIFSLVTGVSNITESSMLVKYTALLNIVSGIFNVISWYFIYNRKSLGYSFFIALPILNVSLSYLTVLIPNIYYEMDISIPFLVGYIFLT